MRKLNVSGAPCNSCITNVKTGKIGGWSCEQCQSYCHRWSDGLFIRRARPDKYYRECTHSGECASIKLALWRTNPVTGLAEDVPDNESRQAMPHCHICGREPKFSPIISKEPCPDCQPKNYKTPFVITW